MAFMHVIRFICSESGRASLRVFLFATVKNEIGPKES